MLPSWLAWGWPDADGQIGCSRRPLSWCLVEPLTLRALPGPEAAPYLDALAHLRITVFREFPYLYDGDVAYEQRYLSRYLECPRSVVVLALDGAAVVGCSTALPLLDEQDAELRAPLAAAGFAPEAVCYFGESILLPGYRGRGAGVGFFTAREDHARAQGLAWCVFCGVQRPADHPRRPADYVPLDAFWRHRGYAPIPVQTTYAWKDLDEDEASDKPMAFWGRRLEAQTT